MRKDQAIKAMYSQARDVITPESAEEMAQAFGMTLAKLGIKPRRVGEMLGEWHPNANQKAVGVDTLAHRLAYKITAKRSTAIS
jgi:hypothetical protein